MLKHLFPKRKIAKSSCYFITIHFPSAEQATYFTEKLSASDLVAARLRRGGETLELCDLDE